MVGRAGWAGFLAWAAAGTVAGVAVAAVASFGLLLLPIAIGVAILVAGRVRAWPESIGALEGVAAAALSIGFLNLGHTPCGSGAVTLAPGQHEVECGGLAPGPFLIAGCLLAIAGAAAYWALRPRR